LLDKAVKKQEVLSFYSRHPPSVPRIVARREFFYSSTCMGEKARRAEHSWLFKKHLGLE
jgi:hypothetical protein